MSGYRDAFEPFGKPYDTHTPVKDYCEFCLGIKRGVRGKEKLIYGVVVCEYCAVKGGSIEKAAVEAFRARVLAALRELPCERFDTPLDVILACIRAVEEL